MSDPWLTQLTFELNNDTPYEIKKLMLYLFTDYYEKHYPEKTPTHEEMLELYEKHKPIINMHRDDCYHNVSLQQCQLDGADLYDIDTGEYKLDYMQDIGNHSIGFSIVSLPRSLSRVIEFFEYMAPYIWSRNPILGIVTSDLGHSYLFYYNRNLDIVHKYINLRDSKLEDIPYYKVLKVSLWQSIKCLFGFHEYRLRPNKKLLFCLHCDHIKKIGDSDEL